jgi:hypothetical protein
MIINLLYIVFLESFDVFEYKDKIFYIIKFDT